MQERELYQPVKEMWEREGFSVNGEINDCDMVCEKDGTYLVCELKCTMSLALLVQGTVRQRICDYVYLCVPRQKGERSNRKLRQLYSMLRRLCLGLIYVSPDKNGGQARVVIEAKAAGLRPNKGRKKKTIEEFHGRISRVTGGVTHEKIPTVYREQSIQLAALLREAGGTLSTRELRSRGGVDSAAVIMRNNFYGWFIHVDRGVYALSEQGRQELTQYEDLVTVFLSKNKQITQKAKKTD